MYKLILFVIFTAAAITLDRVTAEAREKKSVITAYLLFSVCAVAVVTALSLGAKLPYGSDILQTAFKFIKR